MKLRLKGKAVISIIGMLVVFLGASMAIQYRVMSDKAVEVRDAEINAAFHRFRNDIDDFTTNQGAKAAALAQLGSWVYELEQSNPAIDAPNAAMQLALSQLRSVSDEAILGGGIWFEPYVLEKDKRWVGAYAVVDGPGRAKPNWEYSTDKYAYTDHDWYTIAVPKNWDRSRQRMSKLYMTEPYMDSLEGRPTVFITFTHVMYSPKRRLIGVATADWTFDSLKDTLSEFRVTERSFPFLVHEPSNKVLFPVDRAKLALVSSTKWGRHVNLEAARVGVVERVSGVGVDGARYNLMYTRTKAGFVFGHFVATKQAYGFVYESTRLSIFIALLTLLLVGLATYLLVSRLLRPIRELADSARLIADGDLEHVAEVRTSDEVGELALAFNDAHRRARRNAIAVTEASEKLRKSEEHFRALIENATDIVAVLHPDGTMRYASPSLRRVLGRRPEDVRATKLFEYLHADDADEVSSAFGRLVSERSPVESLSLRLSHTDGSWLVFDAICTRFYEGIVVNARDVTEREAAQAALTQSESKLRQAAKLEAVGRLAGGVAHDFNNAMTVVLGSADLLLRRHKGDERLSATLGEIRAAGEHAAALTRQLLTFSRHHVSERRAVNLNEVILHVEKMLRRLIGADVELSTELDAAVTAIHADGRELEQILINLAVNAQDAMGEGGSLLIRTSREVLTAPCMSINGEIAPGDYNVLSVVDTGIGIDATTLTKVFDPFFTTKGAEAGTGLGLSTVYGIVNDTKGYILVDSTPGVGTSFHVYWSPRAASRAGTERLESTQHTGRGEKVLLAEDDAAVREVIATALREGGFEVTEAVDGRAALDLVRDGLSLDLLVTDVVMPRMKGPQLASEVDKLRPGIPVVFVSGYVAGELDAGSVDRTSYVYLQKPFTPDELCEAARRALDGGVRSARTAERIPGASDSGAVTH